MSVTIIIYRIYILAGYQKEDEDNLGIDTYIYYRYFGKSYWNTGGISQYLLLLNLYPLDNSVGIFYRKDFEIWLKLCLIISTLQQN